MWIYATDGMFSIVRDRGQPSKLMVRARKREHLEDFLLDARGINPPEIRHTPDGDYLFRVSLPANIVVDIVRDRLLDIAYGNFKNAAHQISPHDLAYHRTLGETWGVAVDHLGAGESVRV